MRRFRTKFTKPVLTVIAVNTAVWLFTYLIATVVRIKGGQAENVFSSLAMPASLHELLLRPWTPLTYMWSHTSFIHLAVNMLWLYWFWELLSEYSLKKLLLMYFGGGLAAALFFIAASLALHSSGGELIGASGCILSLMGATAIAYPDRRIRFLFFENTRLLWITIAAIMLTLLSAMGLLSLSAHFGGLAAGCCIMGIIKYHGFTSDKVRKGPSVRQVRRFVNSASNARENMKDRLDFLLDRIRISGYNSLTAEERKELNEISVRLNKSDL